MNVSIKTGREDIVQGGEGWGLHVGSCMLEGASQSLCLGH